MIEVNWALLFFVPSATGVNTKPRSRQMVAVDCRKQFMVIVLTLIGNSFQRKFESSRNNYLQHCILKLMIQIWMKEIYFAVVCGCQLKNCCQYRAVHPFYTPEINQYVIIEGLMKAGTKYHKMK